MIYRDDEEALRARRRELIVLRQEELGAISTAALYVRARRSARIAAGSTGIAAAAIMALLSATGTPGATACLVLAWPAMLIARSVVLAGAKRRGMRALHRRYTPSEDVADDLERLDEPVARFVAEAARPLERAATALPMIAFALLLPLTIHFAVYAAIGGVSGGIEMQAFDKWIAVSLVIVGHCHLILSFLCWRFARAAAPRGGVGVDDQGWLAWWIVIVASVFSGLVLVFFLTYAALALVFVVPGLVTTTGLLFIPALFGRAARRIRHERGLLG
jgi:hypothetical protein